MVNQFLLKGSLGLCLLLVLSVLLVSVKSDDDEKQEVDPTPVETPPTTGEDMDEDDDDEFPEVPEGMRRENSVKWSAPNINDEEAHSTRLPSNLKCDGCTAIAYQLATMMSAFHQQKHESKGTKAAESAIIELAEKICDRKTFENYGLKSMNGVNRLSGPGTDAADEPGMMQGGGRWPYRLSMMCGEIVGEVDEYDIYEFILNNGADKLHQFLCENPANYEALNSCGPHMGRDEL